MLLIYTPILKPRLKYIFQLILEELLCIEFKVTTDAEHFSDFIGPKLNYSQARLDKEIFVYAHGFLTEKGVQPQSIVMGKYKGQPTLFVRENEVENEILETDIPFDLFAASFYLVSRYEEYLEVVKDKHGRFPAKASIAQQQGFLHKPLVNIWAKQLLKILQQQYPRLEVHHRKFTFIPTYDIDIAYSYRCKGWLRNVGGYLNSLKRMDFAKIWERSQVLINVKNDPFDNYDYQISLQNEHNLKPIYFFLLGEYGQYDKNISVERRRFQDLIQSVSDYASVGIHPSYRSNDKPEVIEEEIKHLSRIVKREIDRSRQHYVKLHLPETYQQLIKYNITKDYSMGYPDQVGFRASIASSFLFYDLSQEIITNLRIYPFAVMDVTYRFYLKMNQEETIKSIKKLIKEVKMVNGLFMPIWHNSSLSESDGWQGWRTVFEKMIDLSVK